MLTLSQKSLTPADYRALSELRYQIRRFLGFSERIAGRAGLEPSQHQLLLAIKGLPAGRRPRIADLAERLQIKHHSMVELVDRLAREGLVRRNRGGDDRREVLISLTAKGEKTLHTLTLHHHAELRSRGPALIDALKHVASSGRSPNRARKGKHTAQ